MKDELTSRKHKKVSTAPNYSKNCLVLACTITGCLLISTFASLLRISIGNTSSAMILKTFAIELKRSQLRRNCRNNVLKEYDNMKGEIKTLKIWKFKIYKRARG